MEWTGLPTPNVLVTLAGLFAALASGSVIRLGIFWFQRNREGGPALNRIHSLGTWWCLSVLFALATLGGTVTVCLLMAAASILAIREYIRISCVAPAVRPMDIAFMHLATIAGYVAISAGWSSSYPWLIPAIALPVLAAVRVLRGETTEYVRWLSSTSWGVMVLGYGLGHAALLMTMTADQATNAQLFVFLILTTQVNDVAQALIGKKFGAHKRHPIAPIVSPNKTWEGFVGGLVVTILFSYLLDRVVSPLAQFENRGLGPTWVMTVIAGLLIAISGFLGDINMSAVKRDAGIKDSSQLLPGMGGMIDRVDSLTFAAPLFYYFVHLLGHLATESK